MITMSLDHFLATKGVSMPVSDYLLDKTRFPHGLTTRKEKKLREMADFVSREYHAKREAAICEYRHLVEIGEIKPPSRKDVLFSNAMGHPDNTSTQASRRMLVKKGFVTQEELDELVKEWDSRRAS